MSQNSPTTVLVCPKCQGAMRAYERSGVTIDQCTECRGIFLDRGELERLIDAENVYSGGSAQQGGHDAKHGSATASSDADNPKRKKKRSFLEGLFEGGD